jgi:hypothetical protein
MAITKVTSALTDLDGGITIDNITIDGTEIDLSSGDLTIDVAGDIILDADAGVWRFKDAGTTLFQIAKDGQSLVLYAGTSDGDMLFKGNDGGSTVTALTLDMSEAGKATFNSDIVFGGTGTITSATNSLKALNTGDNGFLIRSAVSSAANPSYSNVDDTNTGMFLPGSDVAAFTTGGAERMRIDSSGNLLVGKTSSGALGTAGFELAANDTFRATKDASAPGEFNRLTTDGDIIIFYQNTVARGSISISGANTSYNTSSDARLKDITGEARGLEVINALNPVSYNWKEDGKADEGLIAQEVLDIVPNAVSQNEQDDYYQMDYSKLVTPLIKAIQEQQTIIEDLKSRIETLEG